MCVLLIYREWGRGRRDVRPGDHCGGQYIDQRAGRRNHHEAELLDPRRADQDDTMSAADSVRLSARIHRQAVAATSRQTARRRSQFVESRQPPPEGAQSDNGTR